MIFLTIVLIVIIVLTVLYERTLKPKNYPPGPGFNPVAGTTPALRALAKQYGGVHKGLHKLAEIYKSNVIGMRNGQTLTVCVTDDKTIRDVLTRDEFQARPTSFFSNLRSMGTDKGITFTNGEFWTTQRRFLLRQMRDVGFGKDKMDRIILEETDNIINQLGESETPPSKRIFAMSVLNIIWALFSGVRLDNDDVKLHNLLNLMEERTKWFDMSGGMLNLIPWLRFIAPKASGYTLLTNVNAQMKHLFMGMINEHKDGWYEGRNDDFIYAFMTEMQETKDDSFSEDQLVMICVDLFFGGATTTSTSLEFVLMCMLMYPDVQKKVHKCIDEAYPDGDMSNYKERHLLPYVEAVIYEAMRRYLATPITGPRIALKDTKLESYDIPEGTTILINNYSSNHDPALWKDPEAFRPERFLDAAGNVQVPKHFYPFNIGKRKCPADTLARNCLFTFFTGIMKNFELSLQDTSQKLTGIELPGITISPEPYVACFKRRHAK